MNTKCKTYASVLRELPTLCSVGFLLLSWQGCTPENTKVVRVINGQMEVDEIDVSSRLASRIKKVLVQAGHKVKAGDVLVEFEDDVMAAKKRRAQAAIKAAESQKSIAQNATRPEEKQQAQAGMDAAEKQMQFAKTSLDRMKILHDAGAISSQQFDDVNTKYELAKSGFDAAAAKFHMAMSGARVEQKQAASALVEEAQNALAEVEAYEGDLKLIAPVDGEVQKILNHEGELVPAGYPVMVLIKSDTPWATFHVPESQLKEVTMGKDVSVVMCPCGEVA